MAESTAYAALLRTVQALAQRSSEELWPSLLASAVQVVPGAEAGSILIRVKDGYKTIAVYGYPDELLGYVVPAFLMENWYGPKEELLKAQPSFISGQTMKERLGPSLAFVEGMPLEFAALSAIQSNLIMPIVLSDEPVAFISLNSQSDPDAFTPESLVIARLYMLQATALLAAMFERQELEQRIHELEVLSKLSKTLQTTISLDALIPRIAKEVSSLMDTEDICLALYNPSDQHLETKVATGRFERFANLRLAKTTSLSWSSLESGEIIRLDYTAKSPLSYAPPAPEETPFSQLTAPCLMLQVNLWGCCMWPAAPTMCFPTKMPA